MQYKSVDSEDFEFLKKVCGEKNVFADNETLQEYGHDETENLKFPPQVVVKP
ncbi:MAG: FAD-binding oxidoreductase, partial [Bacteroidetes bacterium]